MNPIRSVALIGLLVCLPAVGACSSRQAEPGGITAIIDGSVARALDKAQAKLRDEPLTVSHDVQSLPTAQITPQGDFVVGGKAIAVTPTQRDALLAYRRQVIVVASEGIAIGKQGAAIGIRAAGSALATAFSGKSGQAIEQQVHAQAAGLRAAVAKLCERLPPLRAEQQKLAAILPEFRPYATMDEQDIGDCRRGAAGDHDDP